MARPPAAARQRWPVRRRLQTQGNAWMWQIQGGITKNWFGLGNTAIYGEYAKAKDWGAELGGRQFVSSIPR